MDYTFPLNYHPVIARFIPQSFQAVACIHALFLPSTAVTVFIENGKQQGSVDLPGVIFASKEQKSLEIVEVKTYYSLETMEGYLIAKNTWSGV